MISSPVTYYVCPAGQTTASYDGAGGVAVAPSDSNDGLSPTTPFATIQKARDVIAGKILLAPVTIQLADTAATSATTVYFPDGILFDNICMGGAVNVFDAAIRGEADAYPTSYVYVRGNSASPGNVVLVGAAAYNGTTPSKRHAFMCKSSNLRVRGMEFRYFASDAVAGDNRALVIGEDVNGLQSASYAGLDQDGLFHVSNQSHLKLGGTVNATDCQVHNADNSTVEYFTPLGYLNLNFTASGASYPQFACLADEKSHVYIEGLTATFSGNGTYNCFGCLIGSTINWNSDVATNITVNAPNATYIKARQGARVFETSGAYQQGFTATAMLRRAWVEEDSIVFIGPSSAMGAAGLLIRPDCKVFQDTGVFPNKNMYPGELTAQGRQLQNTYRVAGNNPWESAVFNGLRARGTLDSPAAVQNGDDLFTINAGGYGDTGYAGQSAQLYAEAAGTFTDSSKPGRWVIATAPAGSASAVARMSVEPSGLLEHDFAFALAGAITPSQITADQNNYDPPNLANAFAVRLSGDSAFRTITGLAGGVGGRMLKLANFGANTLLLANQNAASNDSNRFEFGGYDFPLFPGTAALVRYDATLSRWTLCESITRFIPPARWGLYYRNDLFGTAADAFCSSQVSGTGAANSVAAVTSVAGKPGVVQHQLGTIATNRAAFATTNFAQLLLGNSWYHRYETMVRIAQLSNATDTYTARFGFLDSVSAEPTDGVFFRYTHAVNSGQWQLVARSNGTETATNSSSSVASATWYRLTVIVPPAGSSAEFFVNGTSVGTVAANIPTGSGRGTGFGNALIRSAGTTAANVCDSDYLEVIGYANAVG